MAVRWMTTMTWNSSKSGRSTRASGELTARRMTTTERCQRKMDALGVRGQELLPGTGSCTTQSPEQRQEETAALAGTEQGACRCAVHLRAWGHSCFSGR